MASIWPVPCNMPAHRFEELTMIATAASPSQLVAHAPLRSAVGGGSTLPTKVGDWMVERFGKAAMPIAIGAGAVAGGALGFFTLGPIAGIAGAIGGGWLGALCVGLRP
ncbi:MAG: hypothetical protein JWN72_431 [Thermoleophilia bacterium]|nr:hypothetical protein [Thermoleophilia bacterium]